MLNPERIFSVFKRVDCVFYKENFDQYENLFKNVSGNFYNCSSKFIKNNCKRIYEDIDRGYFTIYDFAVAIIINSIWDTSVDLSKINRTNIDDIKSTFSNKQLEKDRGIIAELNDKLNYDSINEFFRIQEGGTSLIYDLVKSRNISVYFFTFWCEKILTDKFVSTFLFYQSKEYRKFEKTLILLNKLINKPLY